MTIACDIASDLPGRLRLRCRGLGGDNGRISALAERVAREPGICAVRANPDCGSLVMDYDPARWTGVALQAWLAEQPLPAEPCAAQKPAPVRKPLAVHLLVAGATTAVTLALAPVAPLAAPVAAFGLPPLLQWLLRRMPLGRKRSCPAVRGPTVSRR